MMCVVQRGLLRGCAARVLRAKGERAPLGVTVAEDIAEDVGIADGAVDVVDVLVSATEATDKQASLDGDVQWRS